MERPKPEKSKYLRMAMKTLNEMPREHRLLSAESLLLGYAARGADEELGHFDAQDHKDLSKEIGTEITSWRRELSSLIHRLSTGEEIQ